MIPKIGKDHKTLKRYRPLSLTSCLGKLCESIVNEHLVNHCEKLNLFGDQQSAYRSGRCTTDNLLTLTEKATTSFKRKVATAAAFLDVKQFLTQYGTKVSYISQLRLTHHGGSQNGLAAS